MTISRPKSACRLVVRVRFHECDPLGHVNNAVYLHYLEQAAIDHAELVGWPQQRLEQEAGGVFVARRHELDYLRSANEGDHLEVLTWVEKMGMASAVRKYVIRYLPREQSPCVTRALIPEPKVEAFSGDAVVVRAQTVWALVGLKTRRPIPIPTPVVDDFVVDESGIDR